MVLLITKKKKIIDNLSNELNDNKYLDLHKYNVYPNITKSD